MSEAGDSKDVRIAENESTKKLRELLARKITPVADWFALIGSTLMHEWDLSIGDAKFALAEIELYFFDKSHPDTFTHKHAQQLNSSCDWYFHREKSASKSFTLKGLDLTFGAPGKEYGGILIRALKRLENGEFIEGPSKTVDTILDAHSVESVAKLKEIKEFAGDALTNDMLRLTPAIKSRTDAIVCAARFGLSTKKRELAYFSAPYRFRTWPHAATKGKAQLKTAIPLKLPVKKITKKPTDCDVTDDELFALLGI